MASKHQRTDGAWPREVWAWSPEVGRWQPEYGRPKRPVSLELSTDAVKPGEAFEYWRNIAYYHFHASRRPPGGLENFKARARALITPEGDFLLYESSAVCGQRTARHIRSDWGDTFSFGIVLAGRRHHRDETDGVTVAGPGDFFCYDASRVSQVAWDDHRGMHLLLPRTLVDAAVGQPLPPASRLIQRLNHSNLAPFLHSQLRVFGRQFGSLSLRERAAMFEAIVDLLLTVLRQILPRKADSRTADLRAYFAAAKGVIQERFSDPNLAPETIAAALGCSRSTLYRAFHAHQLTVAQYIREVRLQQARRRLAESPPSTPIAAIALECGFCDSAYFRRLFRARFDMSPSDVRGTEYVPPAGDR